MIPDVETAIRLRMSRERHERTHWSTCYRDHGWCATALLLRELERVRMDADVLRAERDDARRAYEMVCLAGDRIERIMYGVDDAS